MANINRITIWRIFNDAVTFVDVVPIGDVVLNIENGKMYKCVSKISRNTPFLDALNDEKLVPISSFDEHGTYPNMSVGFAENITPSESDSVIDNTAFVWQTSGGSANIPASSVSIVQEIGGNSLQNSNDGKLYPFKATSLYSRIFNLFNHDDVLRKVEGKRLNATGNITDNAYYTTYWVKVLRGVNNGNNGYVFSTKSGETFSSLGFAVDSVGFQVEEPTSGTTQVDIIPIGIHGSSASYLPSQNGWLVFSLYSEKGDGLCVHFAWSGYRDEDFEEYEAHGLDMPQQVQNGLWGLGSVCDMITIGKHTQKIGHIQDSKTLVWSVWTERVYDIATQTYIEQFMGYKTNGVVNIIRKLSTNIASDNVFSLHDWQSDADGWLKVMADGEEEEILAQLTEQGIHIIFELQTYVETEIGYNGILTVGDFGDEMFLGTQIVEQGMMGSVAIAPMYVTQKYGANYRDAIRLMSNSGVVFSTNGVTTSGLYFGGEPSLYVLNGNNTFSFGELQRNMQITLNGNAVITLPNGGTKPFDIRLKIVQDGVGSRSLTLQSEYGVGVHNVGDFDFSSGGANQRCVSTLVWDGSEWWFTTTDYFDI